MKVAIDWLTDLVNIKDINEVIRLLPLRTIGTKEVMEDFIELDMKGYNRADLLSMRGVAYEVAAITDSKVKFTEEDPKLQELSNVKVQIENPKLCPIYCVAKIENLKVQKSDETWVKKLNDCGLRTVNNIADVTNLVMLEFGQPLHAFDATKVSGETIVVRTARNGEKIVTLDAKERSLESSDLLIADPKKALGIAGVMGGQNSEVTDTTTAILLEAAIFEPTALRATSTRMGITSEASKRFYHGLTKKRLMQALDSATKMYEKLGGKLTALTIVGDFEDKQKTIELTKEKLDSLIGMDIPSEDIEKYLKNLKFTILVSKGQALRGWEVKPPYFRLDINIEEDLVEEVARMYGYEKIPAKPLEGEVPATIDQSLFELVYKIKKALVEEGLTEIQTYSFYSTQVLKNLGWVDNLQYLLKVSNPISSETEYLKQDLWPNLLEKVAQNIKKGFSDIAIFEIGKVYYPKENTIPDEHYCLSIALMNDSNNPMQELYNIFQEMLKKIEVKLDLATEGVGEYEKRWFHPTRAVLFKKDDKLLRAGIGEVHPRIVNKFGIEKRVAVLEIELIALL